MFQRTSRRTGGATTPASGSVTNAQLASMAAGTVKGRQIDAGSGVPVDLTGTELGSLIRFNAVQNESVSGTVNDLTVNATTDVIRFTPSGSHTLTGLSGGTSGRILFLENVAGVGNNLTLASLSASSSTANRLRTPNGQDIVLKFRESVIARWDTGNGDWRIDAGMSVVSASGLATIANNIAVPFAVYVSCPSGGSAGTADDVTIWSAAAPFALRILDATLRVSTAVGGSSAALRTASGGGGSVVMPDPGTATQTFSTAAVGVVEDLATATATVAPGGSLFLRRSDRSVVGELILECIRT